MGIVYSADDETLHRRVALKFLPQTLLNSGESRQRFLLEARAAAALSHPNICTVQEIQDKEERSFLVMEYIEGRSLRETVRGHPLEPGEAARIAAQVAEALEEAHAKGIVHRDIKSANIMLTAKGQAKVMDFGLAKVTSGSMHTREGVLLGTVDYMSPEQAQAKPVDCRTDIWSLGVVLYEMLTGRLPFTGEQYASILYSIIRDEPRPLREMQPGVPPELCDIVSRALTKDRDARYSSAGQMLEDLRRYLGRAKAAELRAAAQPALLRLLGRPRAAIPFAIGLVLLAAASYWYADHRAKVRWARDVALPEIERMIGNNDVWRNLTDAYSLAVKAEAVLPHDPRLASLFSKCSVVTSIRTEPAGAAVYVKDYKAPESPWRYVGVTPIEKTRLPIGVFRWKLEKEGYEPVLAAASSWDVDLQRPDIIVPFPLVRTLDRRGSMPAGMVRVTGAKTSVGDIPDFYIDTNEVTNKRFKEFIDHDGYRNRKLWKRRFIENGRDLPWDQAVTRFVDQTGQPGPATWHAGDYLEGQDDYPVSGISWYEAAAFAEYAGRSLPTGEHWNLARGGNTPLIQYPQLEGYAVFAPFSNFSGKGPRPVGSLPGITCYGALDMAGNVREWCWNETSKGRLIRGGAWNDNTYMFGALSQAEPMDRSARNGFRCALYPDPAKIPAAAFEKTGTYQDESPLGVTLDAYHYKPVSDAVFHVFKEQFSYDRTDLKARVEARHESPGGWVEEQVSLDAAYGPERVTAFLFLPKNATPPFQTVIYFPGSAPIDHRSSKDIENYYEFPLFLSFLVKNGRAVLFPVYKGTFERGSEAMAAVLCCAPNTHQSADLLIKQVKDLRRCIDYLETRQDIDAQKIAYYGMSWGAGLGSVIPAVEARLKASVLVAGAVEGLGLPEVNDLNYVGRVKIPTLMLNGKYDTLCPYDTRAKPMFDLLGTPAGLKVLKTYETDHIPPRDEYIRETLAWLDRYLGPVRRQ